MTGELEKAARAKKRTMIERDLMKKVEKQQSVLAALKQAKKPKKMPGVIGQPSAPPGPPQGSPMPEGGMAPGAPPF